MSAHPPEFFPCPHCAAVYPFKAVLVGRVVRCRACHHAFLVRADGTAEKAAEGAAATAEPMPGEGHEATSEAGEKPGDKKGAGTRRHHQHLTSQQEEMRHQMSAALADAALRAAQAAGPVPGPEAGNPPGTKRQARTAGEARAPLERRLVEAVLTQSGAREQREERRRLLMIAGVFAAFFALFAGWWWWPDAERDALRAFARPPADGMVVLRDFPDTVSRRGWVVGEKLPLVDVGRVGFASEHSVPVAGWIGSLDGLKGLSFDAGRRIWTPPGRAKEIAGIWQATAARAVNLAAVGSRMKPVVDQDAVVAELQRHGLSPGDALLVGHLVSGTGPEASTPMATALLADPPSALVLGGFSGHGGCVRLGRGVAVVPVGYGGTLLRFMGGKWPTGWRVLEVHGEPEAR